MSKIEWRVDAGTQVVLRNPPFLRRKVELNGERVDGEWRSKSFGFNLPDGRSVEITLKADTISRTTELSLDGKLIPDIRYVPKDLRCPACKAEIQLLDKQQGQTADANEMVRWVDPKTFAASSGGDANWPSTVAAKTTASTAACWS